MALARSTLRACKGRTERWYLRSPQEIEQEKREAEDRRHAQFVASIRENEREPVAGSQTPIDGLVDAFHDWQQGPKMQRPNLAESSSRSWVQHGRQQPICRTGTMPGPHSMGLWRWRMLLPVGTAVKGLRAASKGVGVLKKGP
jgi:hypothetical protein